MMTLRSIFTFLFLLAVAFITTFAPARGRPMESRLDTIKFGTIFNISGTTASPPTQTSGSGVSDNYAIATATVNLHSASGGIAA